MMRILVTALGTLNSTFISNYLMKKGHYIVGVDIFSKEYIRASNEVSKFYTVPSIYEMGNYKKALFNICEENKIEYIIPIIDEEILYFSGIKNEFENIGVKVCSPNFETVQNCRDKFKTFEIIKKHIPEIYVKTIKISNYNNEFDYPFFIKPNSGRASIGCVKIKSKKHFDYIKEECEGQDFIVQEFLQGKFIAVDFINDIKNNQFFALSREELLRNSNGCGTVVKIFKSQEIENIVRKIANTLNYNGVGNVEFVINDNKISLIEVNPRFPAGTEYSVRAGADFILDELKLIQGKQIETNYNINYDTIFTRRYEAYEYGI
ncbi:MAG: ATP-grasp domain-containing protein [Lentisphaeria bacterium]|nr:ATP-grasp domain-containing protein [Lentisphaeria bacterium]